MLWKIYRLTFEFLRANDGESFVYVKNDIRKENILQNTTPFGKNSSYNKGSYPVTVTEIVSHFKWSFRQLKAGFKIENYLVVQLKGYIG